MESRIRTLGPATVASPVKGQRFVSEEQRLLYAPYAAAEDDTSFELAGPRDRLFFDPESVGCAIVTCGGLCPGLNDVIRGIVLALWHTYGARRIYGVRNGYRGLVERHGIEPVALTPEDVDGIHDVGGSILGTSRGAQDPGEVADWLAARDIGVLFAIGGDGTLRGALGVEEELKRRGQRCAVVCVPKTIDNDIGLVARSFGFDTAVERAREAIAAAHTEAKCAVQGVGIVKLMGRYAGFLAATASLAQSEVNACLIPEADFDLDGDHGLLAFVEQRLQERSHALVVVAEAAGQKFVKSSKAGVDASGNPHLGDIGGLLCARVQERFGDRDGFSLKYIDPSYLLRGGTTTASDSVFCTFLAYNAVHAGLAGKTGVLVGVWNNNYVHVPIREAVAHRKTVDTDGTLWSHVLETTGQPSFLPP